MKKTVSTETDNIDSSTETKNIKANTPNRMSGHRIENTFRSSITSEEVTRQIMAVTDSLTRQLERLSELMRERSEIW